MVDHGEGWLLRNDMRVAGNEGAIHIEINLGRTPYHLVGVESGVGAEVSRGRCVLFGALSFPGCPRKLERILPFYLEAIDFGLGVVDVSEAGGDLAAYRPAAFLRRRSCRRGTEDPFVRAKSKSLSRLELA